MAKSWRDPKYTEIFGKVTNDERDPGRFSLTRLVTDSRAREAHVCSYVHTFVGSPKWNGIRLHRRFAIQYNTETNGQKLHSLQEFEHMLYIFKSRIMAYTMVEQRTQNIHILFVYFPLILAMWVFFVVRLLLN